MSLKELSTKYDYKEDTELLDLIELAMREDVDHPSSIISLAMIDEGKVKSEEDFNELIKNINNFVATTKSFISNPDEISYIFEPPTDVQEFGGIEDLKEESVDNSFPKAYFYEKGVRMEKVKLLDGSFTTVGPVDDNNNPLPGHPEFVVENSEPTPSIEDTTAKSIKEKTHVEALTNTTSQAQMIFNPPKRKLSVVRAHLPNVGMFEYEVVGFEKNRHSITLVFDPTQAKPPFYPEVRLGFTLEYKQNTYEVIYLGVCFDFEGLKFMCFNTEA